MADLPRILARPELPQLQLPRVSAEAAGKPWAQLSQAAGQWETALREKQAPVDAALAISEYNIKAEELKQEVQADPDSTQWTTNWRKKEQQMRAEIIAPLTDPRAKMAVNLAANKSLDTHIIDLSKQALIGAQAKMKSDVKVASDSLAREAANTTNPDLKQQHEDIFEGLVRTAEQPTRIGNKIFAPTWSKGEADQARQEFQQKVLSHTADGQIERDAPQFLQDLKAGRYDLMDSDKRRQKQNAANTAITSGTSAYKLAQKEKEEAADRDIQMMIDKRVSTDIIQRKLEDYTASGVMQRTQRAHWDDRLMKGEKADDPVQTANFEKLKADFTSERPTGARVKQFRAQTQHMRDNFGLGDKGAAVMGNMINVAEAQLEAQGRAQRGEARAIESHGRAGAGGKMSPAQGYSLIQKNFPAESAGHPQSRAHKDDVQEMVTRVDLGEEDRATVAKEITDRRMKTQQREKQLRDAKIQVIQKNPNSPAAAMLGDLNAMKIK